MIVDDSIVARTVLGRLLEARPEFEVTATAGNAAQALTMLASIEVDTILLDVEMPGIDGLTALPEILIAARGARVLIVSSAAEVGAMATVKALTLGAADTLLKPGAGSFAGRFADELVERLLRIGHPRRDSPAPEPRTDVHPAFVKPRSDAIGCVAIGASTGGMHALSAFFKALDRAFRPPILITQHLPAVFMPYFAAQLQDIAGRPARVAADGARVTDGEIMVAPGDAHMRLMRMNGAVRVRLDQSPAASGCMPSVDPMLAAFATVYGAAGVGVVLSGMGRDGLIGARDLAAEGGEVLAQDAATSVVWGMPRGVAEAGIASAILPPAALAHRIADRARNSAWK